MEKKSEIEILSLYFYPDVASTGQLLDELALKISEKGINVSVTTAIPTYDLSIEAKKFEIKNGIRIKRFSVPRLNKKSKLSTLAISFTFFIKVFLKLLFSRKKTNLLIVSNPPFLPIVGLILNKLRKINFIYLIHDIHPEYAEKIGYIKKDALLSKIWIKIRELILKHAKFVIVLSNDMKNMLLKISNVDKNKIKIIPNWADEVFFSKLPKKDENLFINKYELQDKFVVMYSGNLGYAYNLEEIINVAYILKTHECIHFIIAGNGVKKEILQKLVLQKKIKNVSFIPYQPKEYLLDLLTSADISIITYEKKLEGLLMPSKLYTSIASKTPIIALCRPESEVGRLIISNNCGYCVDNDVYQFSNYILEIKNSEQLRKNFSNNAYKLFKRKYTLDLISNEYKNLIVNL